MRFTLLAIILAGVLTLGWAAEASSFREVNPERSSPEFRLYVERALDVLARGRSPLARFTRQAIESGRVKIDEISDLTYRDYLEVLRNYRKAGTPLGLTARDWRDLQRPGSRALRILRQQLDGYQWDDRIYITFGDGPATLASTLVHEVNHVLNRSNHHYATPRAAFIEEYRAFYVEAVYRGRDVSDPAVCLRIKRLVNERYGFGIDPATIPDRPPGLFVPRGF